MNSPNGLKVGDLTDKHRVEYRDAYGDGTHETGIHYSRVCKCWFTNSGKGIVRIEGHTELDPRVVRVIPPPFEPKTGMAVRRVREGFNDLYTAVRLPDNVWQASKSFQEEFNTPEYLDDEEVETLLNAGEIEVWS